MLYILVLRMPIKAYLTVAQGVSFHMMSPLCMGQMSYNPATTNQNVTTLSGPTLKKSFNTVYSGGEFPGLKTTVLGHFWAVLGAYKRHTVPPYTLVYFLPRFVLNSGGSKIRGKSVEIRL